MTDATVTSVPVSEQFREYMIENDKRIQMLEDRLRLQTEEIDSLKRRIVELQKVADGKPTKETTAPSGTTSTSAKPSFMLNLSAVKKDQAEVPSSARSTSKQPSPRRPATAAAAPATSLESPRQKTSRFSPARDRAARMAAGKEMLTGRTEGDGITYRPLRGVVYAPTNFKPTAKGAQPPADQLQLDYVYGYRGHDARMNAFYTATGDVVYHAAAVGVVMNPQTRQQWFFVNHTNDISCLALHPDGDLVATGQTGKDPRICVWRASSLESVRVLEHYHERGVTSVSFSPDGKYLVSVGADNFNTVVVWDWERGVVVANERGGSERVIHVTYGPGLFCTCGVKNIRFWSLPGDGTASGKNGIFGAKGTLQPILCVSADSESRYYTGTQSGQVYIWRAGAIAEAVDAHDGPVFAVHADAEGVITGGRDGFVRLWSPGMKQMLGSIELPKLHGRSNTVRALHRRGNRLIAGLRSNVLVEVDISTGETFPLTESHEGELWGLATHPTSPLFVTACNDGTVRVWDAEQHRQRACVEVGDAARSAAFHPTMPVVAVGCANGSVVVVDYENARVVLTRRDRKEPINDLKFSPDGLILAAGTSENTIDMYQTDDAFNFRGTCKGHSSSVTHLDWTADGSALQSTSTAYELLYWDASGRSHSFPSAMRDAEWHTWTSVLGWPVIGIWPKGSDGSDVNAVCRSHDGSLLATGDDQGNVRLFRFPCFTKAALPRIYSGHSSHVTNVRWLADDHYLLSAGGLDMCVFQWRRLEGDDTTVSADLSPAGLSPASDARPAAAAAAPSAVSTARPASATTPRGSATASAASTRPATATRAAPTTTARSGPAVPRIPSLGAPPAAPSGAPAASGASARHLAAPTATSKIPSPRGRATGSAAAVAAAIIAQQQQQSTAQSQSKPTGIPKPRAALATGSPATAPVGLTPATNPSPLVTAGTSPASHPAQFTTQPPAAATLTAPAPARASPVQQSPPQTAAVAAASPAAEPLLLSPRGAQPVAVSVPASPARAVTEEDEQPLPSPQPQPHPLAGLSLQLPHPQSDADSDSHTPQQSFDMLSDPVVYRPTESALVPTDETPAPTAATTEQHEEETVVAAVDQEQTPASHEVDLLSGGDVVQSQQGTDTDLMPQETEAVSASAAEPQHEQHAVSHESPLEQQQSGEQEQPMYAEQPQEPTGETEAEVVAVDETPDSAPTAPSAVAYVDDDDETY